MIIRRLTLRSWLCFRGQHVLDLDAKAYAVVARHSDDEARSNWCGKTAVVESVPFALFGQHRHRTEDDWISRGEPIGSVELVLQHAGDHGPGSEIRVLRERHRGKPTVLHVDVGDKHLRKDEAQSFIDRVLCLSEQDFKATCWFEQREMAKLVLAEPSDRMRIVGGWLDLEPLERCCSNAGRRLQGALDEVGSKLAAIRAREELLDQVMHAPDGGAVTLGGLKSIFMKALDAVLLERGEVVKAEAAVAENNRCYQLKVAVGEHESVAAELARVEATVEGGLPLITAAALSTNLDAAQAKLNETGAVVNKAKADLHQKDKLAAGEFDGACPVAGIQCPAQGVINADRVRSRALRETARAALQAAETAYRGAYDTWRAASEAVGQHDAAQVKLNHLRQRLAELEPRAAEARRNPVRDGQALANYLSSRREVLEEANRAHVLAEQSLNDAVRLTKEVEESAGERGKLEARLVDLRAAVQLFGKNGAQRALAEGALSEIEDDANGALAEAGIDLQVAVRWGREGSGPAKVCDACGTPFPSSAKVKDCGRCGAVRGPHVVPRLDIVPSDRSGAADDLAGAFTQLAAAKWLKAERGSTWSCALLDELWGQLDSANRKALTVHVASLLRDRYGFTQSLVVAHNASVLDSLPGRILVESDGDWSTARVI